MIRQSIVLEEHHIAKLEQIIEAYKVIGAANENYSSVIRTLIERAEVPEFKGDK
jgi:hypothetical protein